MMLFSRELLKKFYVKLPAVYLLLVAAAVLIKYIPLQDTPAYCDWYSIDFFSFSQGCLHMSLLFLLMLPGFFIMSEIPGLFLGNLFLFENLIHFSFGITFVLIILLGLMIDGVIAYKKR